MATKFQVCMKKALKGKHVKGKVAWRAAFTRAAKACGRKVRASGTRRKRRRK